MIKFQIRRKTAKVWQHFIVDGNDFIFSKCYCKTNGNKFRVVEDGGTQKDEYNYDEIEVYDDLNSGSAETFTSSLELMERLSALQYVGFSKDGDVVIADLISSDSSNALEEGSDGKLFVPESSGGGIESVTGSMVDNTDPLNPVILSDNTKQDKVIVVSSSITASNDQKYHVVANATFTDPSPVEGKGYEVFVRNGVATIGGVAYPVGSYIFRTFHSGSWESKLIGGGSSKNIHTISMSFGSAWLGNLNASWRTSLYTVGNIYTNSIGTSIGYDSVNNIVTTLDTRTVKWMLPFNCKLKDIQSFVAGAVNTSIDFRIFYAEMPTAFTFTNFVFLGKVVFPQSGVGGLIYPTISNLNTTTSLNKGGYIFIIWFNNTANPTFNTSLIQPIFEEI